MDKAKIEAYQAISIIESQLKFLDKSECFQINENLQRDNIICTTETDRNSLIHKSEEELLYLQSLPSKEKSIEVKLMPKNQIDIK